jgi:hypothetical protein
MFKLKILDSHKNHFFSKTLILVLIFRIRNRADSGTGAGVQGETVIQKQKKLKISENIIIFNNMEYQTIKGEHSIQEDIQAVNPDYEDGGDEYEENCINCAGAYEMRRRGADVEACPLTSVMYDEDWETLFDGFSPLKVTSRRSADAIDELIQEILSWDTGSNGVRGTIMGVWQGRQTGHAFSFEVYDNEVKFIDSQNGDDDVASYLKQMEPSSIRYGRLDNLNPSSKIKKSIRNRRGT